MIGTYLAHIVILICIYGMLSIGLNISLGFGGLLNLGHITFFGAGAYASALLSLGGCPWVLCFMAGGIVAAVLGFILSLASIRLRHDYFCLATLAFNLLIYSSMLNIGSMTNGAQGIAGIPHICGMAAQMCLAIIALCITYAAVRCMEHSGFGRALQAVRDEESLAQAIGIDAFAVRSRAMVYSASIAGIAGCLYAHYIGFIDPSICGLMEMVSVLAIVILGGLASIRGTVMAAALLTVLPEALRFIAIPSSVLGPLRSVMYATILLFILAFLPRGMLGRIDIG